MTPGLKTSEFKVAVLTVIAAVVSYEGNWVSHKYAWAGGVVAAISYIVSRGLAKNEQRGTTNPPN